MSPSEDDMWLVAFQLGRRLALCRLLSVLPAACTLSFCCLKRDDRCQHLAADLTVEQGKATCPMSPSVCPFAPCKPFFSGELKLGSSVGAWEEALVFILQEELPGSWEEVRGSPELGGGGLLATRRALEGCAGLGVAFLKATPGLSPSQSEKRVLLQTAGFARVIDFGSSRGKRWDSDVVVCGALLAETGTPVVCDSYGAVQLVHSNCLTLRGSGETSQQFPPWRSEETGPQ
ncbi:hypothetical protein Taro_052935 [Colocasia esculenta]|uniref:Uncharacterized protein n=1 Tax=Colocasia esculenta TaxID=4460 RepID=A0A843XL51_COLES|nr:hypothetical protein [Colocasia esculenta]